MQIQSSSPVHQARTLPKAAKLESAAAPQGDLVEIGSSTRDMGPDPITPLFYATAGAGLGGISGGVAGALWASSHGALAGVGGFVGGAVAGGALGMVVAGVLLKMQK